ncbi:MAG: hypothetical protein LBH44_11810 [Treponema sp.]|jgi:hypothetical protein|nr:hypothetical protein [Treponema sp.]
MPKIKALGALMILIVFFACSVKKNAGTGFDARIYSDLLSDSEPSAIIFSTQIYPDPLNNPEPAAEVVNLVKKALYRLADDPKLARHPVRRYVYESDVLAKIIFDNPGTIDGAKVVNHNEIHINSEMDFAYYLVTLAHEFVHIGIIEKYGDPSNFSFLPPVDFAFINLMEEAFANALGIWVRLGYPEVPGNREIRHHRNFQNSYPMMADAMRNDLLASSSQNKEQIIDKVTGELFNEYMTSPNVYTLREIPRNMALVYGRRNTFLIPEYNAYSAYSDELLRHMWNYLHSMMPFTLPGHFSYDYYRSMFASCLAYWNAYAYIKSASILYWVNFNARGAALARLGAVPIEEKLYDYLPREDEERLNRVMLEINPYFTSVNLSR